MDEQGDERKHPGRMGGRSTNRRANEGKEGMNAWMNESRSSKGGGETEVAEEAGHGGSETTDATTPTLLRVFVCLSPIRQRLHAHALYLVTEVGLCSKWVSVVNLFVYRPARKGVKEVSLLGDQTWRGVCC